jgi:hypothetical protein
LCCKLAGKGSLWASDALSPALGRKGEHVMHKLNLGYPDIDLPPRVCVSPMCGMSCSAGVVGRIPRFLGIDFGLRR